MQTVPLCDGTWEQDLAKMVARVGPPTKVDGDKFSWAVVDGESCAMLSIIRGECPPSWNKPGARLYSAVDPVLTTPTTTVGDHAGCLATAAGGTASPR